LDHHSQGSPLFIEQLASYIEQVGGDSAKQLRDGLETRLELSTIIRNRLDCFGPNLRNLVQIAASVGMYFDTSIVQRLVPDCDDALQAGLDASIWSVSHRQTYVFYHALIRDAALNSIDPAQRQQIHLRIAEACLDFYGEKGAYGLVAEQYLQAGEYEKALFYLTHDAHQQVKASHFSQGSERNAEP
jgi:predicted ATPase